MIRDRNIDWIRKRIYIPARDFGMWTEPIAEATGTGSSQDIAHLLGTTPQVVFGMTSEADGTAEDTVLGTHDGTNIKVTMTDAAMKLLAFAALAPTEYSTFGFGGFHIQTAGDIYSTFLRCPYDVDPAHAIGFKVNFVSGSSTAADIFDWIILADFKAVAVALLAPTTVLDTVVDIAGTLGTATADLNSWSSRGVKNSGFLTRDEIEAGAAIMFSVELDSTQSALASEELHFLGCELDYVPLKTRGLGRGNDALLAATGGA